ncbi:MAG: hypothetical protein ABWY64_02295 [Tardiphaga sp.]|jgi:hypothetical protein
MFNNTQSVHRQITNFELVETCLLDHQATDRKSANRQYTDGDRAERGRSRSKRQ